MSIQNCQLKESRNRQCQLNAWEHGLYPGADDRWEVVAMAVAEAAGRAVAAVKGAALMAGEAAKLELRSHLKHSMQE